MYGWGTPDWRAAVRDWAGGEPVEHLTRPWSTVWTVGTGPDRRWFKENCPPHRNEAGVHAALARLAPDHVDAPVAVDPDRGWLLTPDGGPTLADATPGGTRGVEVAPLRRMLRDYAALQRATVGHRDGLIAAGIRLPGDPAAVAREQAEALAALPEEDPRRITEEQRDTVLAALPALTGSAEALGAGPVPPALDQCDLFPRNVFVPRPGGPYRFFDFADGAWTHPFGSLVMLVWELRHRWGLPRDEPVVDCTDPRIRAVFDAYLGCWTDLAPLPELRELAGHALRLAPLHRSAAWFRILAGADAAALAAHGRTPWSWLEDVARPVLV